MAVLATGHQVASSAEGTVLINVSRMDTRYLDPDRRFIRVAGGTRWRDVLFEVLDRAAVEQLTRWDPQAITAQVRFRLERVLNLAVWTDMYRPEVTF